MASKQRDHRHDRVDRSRRGTKHGKHGRDKRSARLSAQAEAARAEQLEQFESGAHIIIPAVSQEAGAAKKKQKSAFLCEVELRNALPEPPLEPKLRNIPLDTKRLTRCLPALDHEFKFDLLTDWNMGIPPEDLLDETRGRGLTAEESALLAELSLDRDAVRGAGSQVADIRSQGFSWLRRPDYVTPVVVDSSSKQVARGHKAREEALEAARASREGAQDRLTQIRAIEASFASAREAPVHPTEPALGPSAIMPLLPHPLLLAARLAWVSFDADPTAADAKPEGPREQLRLDDTVLTEARFSVREESGAEQERAGERHLELYARAAAPDGEEPPPPDHEELEAALRSGSLAHSDYFTWVRQYERAPGCAPATHNNFVFVTPPDERAVKFGRYDQRINLRKRKAAPAAPLYLQYTTAPLPNRSGSSGLGEELSTALV